MQIKNYFQQMSEIYKHLQDDESKKLFEARIAYLIENDKSRYISRLGEIYQDWYCAEDLKEEFKHRKFNNIIIFGCGYLGMMLKGQLEAMGYKVGFFCDNNYKGNLDGIKVLSVNELKNQYNQDDLIIIGTYKYREEIYQQLCAIGISSKNILKYEHIDMFGKRGWQYFDVFSPKNNEIFVDAGAFDGENIFDFCTWTKNKYRKVYAFEPIPEMCEKLKNDIKQKNLYNIQVINGPTWDKKEQLHFADEGTSTSLNEEGTLIVKGVDIDSVIGDEEVTFIKMDIEGSELKALQGARKTIVQQKPRLAICIYHKSMDIIEIPTYLMSLVPEYKFYIRHYTAYMQETVLYATIGN